MPWQTNALSIGEDSRNYYFIKTDIISNIEYTDNSSDLIVKFRNLNGIPLNLINVNYPINENQKSGYHIISNIIDESYS